ncbi:translation initiation factor IF-2-like isoform X5 [Synchiropus splendidus]|uniref:translation initiation factor IF-2-like isoform X5 n=1 Tax=Synchiropus splendidus TaxID=270530 RepID=UPI00237E9267|nr:translation initiation factor IF-2-like isoform X5 [Synchiropus splendidus]
MANAVVAAEASVPVPAPHMTPTWRERGAGAWRSHVVHQLKLRDAAQRDTFRDLIRFCESSFQFRHWSPGEKRSDQWPCEQLASVSTELRLFAAGPEAAADEDHRRFGLPGGSDAAKRQIQGAACGGAARQVALAGRTPPYARLTARLTPQAAAAAAAAGRCGGLAPAAAAASPPPAAAQPLAQVPVRRAAPVPAPDRVQSAAAEGEGGAPAAARGRRPTSPQPWLPALRRPHAAVSRSGGRARPPVSGQVSVGPIKPLPADPQRAVPVRVCVCSHPGGRGVMEVCAVTGRGVATRSAVWTRTCGAPCREAWPGFRLERSTSWRPTSKASTRSASARAPPCWPPVGRTGWSESGRSRQVGAPAPGWPVVAALTRLADVLRLAEPQTDPGGQHGRHHLRGLRPRGLEGAGSFLRQVGAAVASGRLCSAAHAHRSQPQSHQRQVQLSPPSGDRQR